MRTLLAFALVLANCGTKSLEISYNDNPCSQYFNYYKDQSGGTLLIPPPGDSSKVNLVVEIMVHTKLIDTSYVGKITIAENVNSIFRRLQNNDRSPIKFQLHFPVRSPIPYLTRISVNGLSICSYEPVGQQGVFTSIKLNYDMYYDSKERGNYNYQNNQPAPIVQTTCAPQKSCICPEQRPIICPNVASPARCPPAPNVVCPAPTKCPTVPSPLRCPPVPAPVICPSEEVDNRFGAETFYGCGKSSSTKIPVPLISNGHEIFRGSYPWLSAIYENNGRGPQFVCSGSLVTNKHIITAAHCVSKDQRPKKAKNFVIFLGKHNIFTFTEREAAAVDIEKITNHPGYTGDLHNAGVDLAIISFKTPIRFNAYIRPVCLWNPERNIPNSGQVVGWGRDEYGNSLTSTPKEIEMSVHSDYICKQDNDIANLMTNWTLCAGSRQDNGPCKGDSGGGLYIRSAQSKRWYIRGIVSQALWDHTQNSCDLSKNVVFTDVSKTLSWIFNEISLDHTVLENDY
ncbi:serine protease gd-like [Neocloeon triangulifer]|uniref:serine protease gd-like n=1 Tax=Neocloeon triangulifer TaxID=2078957 RepID=UPI00286F615E|nr:serine protease gd-like [Neocloeon triangulifer]